MKKKIDKCYNCNGKARRLCPAMGKAICSTCCGSERGTQINCGADCPHSPFSIKGYDLWLRTDANLAPKMLRHMAEVYDKNYFEKIANSMSLESERNRSGITEPTAFAAIYYLLFVKRTKSGRTLACDWKDAGWNGLTNDERGIMDYRLSCRATVVEIQKILDNQAMECIDLFDPEKGTFILLDRSIAAHAVRFARYFIWLAHYPYFSRPEGTCTEITDFIFEEFMDTAGKEFKREAKKQREFTMKDCLSER